MKAPIGGGGQSKKVTKKAARKVVRKASPPKTEVQATSGYQRSASGVKGSTNAAGKPSRGVQGQSRRVVRKAAKPAPTPIPVANPLGANSALKYLATDKRYQRAMAASLKPVKVAGIEAPILGVLEQTTRPLHGVAGAADAIIHGRLEDVPKQVKEGLIDNKPYTFGKILKDAGAPDWLAGSAGFVLDVAGDPTTYATFGVGSVAHQAAARAGESVFKKAIKGGMTEAGARTVARRAAEKAANAAAPGSGLTVKFVGKELPGVRRSTATAGRTVKRVTAKTPGPVKRAAGGAKNLVGDVRPQMRRAGVDEAEHVAVRRAGARARAEGAQGMARATRRARAARRVIPKDQYEAVIDAIEKGRIGKLPEELREPAIQLRAELRHAKRVRRQAGISEGDISRLAHTESPAEAQAALQAASTARKAADARLAALESHPGSSHVAVDTARIEARAAREAESQARKRVKFVASHQGAARNYFPHALADELKAGQGVHETVPAVGRKGVRKVTLASSKKRTDLRALSEQNPERLAAGETPFSTNLPLVYGNYLADTSKAVAAKNLAVSLRDAGRPFRNGMDLHPEDVVFHFHNGDLTPLKKIPESVKPTAGQYVVLNQRAVEREFANIAPGFDRTHVGALFDKGTAAFKRIATFTPGFHARNAVGDTQMAYLVQPGHKIPGNLKQAGRAVRRMSGVERAEERTLGAIAKDTRRVKLRRSAKDSITVAGKPLHVDEFVAMAQREGVVRSGYIGRELREQGHGVGKGYKRIGGRVSRAGHTVNRWMQNREDVVRLSTFKYGLDKGLTADQAADLARNTHIDYGDLTKFERVGARRAMPFYTFSSRALPIHGKALVQRPGKFANYQKLREEASLATGVDLPEDEKLLKVYQKRQAPLILNINGEKTVVSDALPLTLLNELPVTDPATYISEISQWLGQLANPILKDPVEFYANRSFFFRNDIQPNDYPMVAAPSWVKAIYEHAPGLAKKLGIKPDYIDRKTGKKTWGWYGKADYVFKSIPGIPLFVQQMTQTGNRRGQSSEQKALGFVAGVRAEPLDPDGALTEVLFQEHDELERKIGALRQREHSPANTREAARLRAQQKLVERQIYKVSKKRGDAIPLYRPTGGGSGPSVGGGLGSNLSSGLGG